MLSALLLQATEGLLQTIACERGTVQIVDIPCSCPREAQVNRHRDNRRLGIMDELRHPVEAFTNSVL
jgi:hypothetical protein